MIRSCQNWKFVLVLTCKYLGIKAPSSNNISLNENQQKNNQMSVPWPSCRSILLLFYKNVLLTKSWYNFSKNIYIYIYMPSSKSAWLDAVGLLYYKLYFLLDTYSRNEYCVRLVNRFFFISIVRIIVHTLLFALVIFGKE